MGPVGDSDTGLPDAISLALGKITLDRDNKEAVMHGSIAGRKIRVVASYENADFTVEQVRRDLNEALDQYHPRGRETGTIELTQNVHLYFESESTKKASAKAAETLTKTARPRKVEFAEREEARLWYGDTKVEEKRLPGEKGVPEDQGLLITQKHVEQRGPTLSAQSIREEFGPTQVPLELLTLDSFRQMDVDWLHQQALVELKKTDKKEPTDTEIYHKMFQLNHRRMDFSAEELLALMLDMKKLPPQLDIQKGKIAFQLLTKAREALKAKNQPSTFEGLHNELMLLNNPRTQLTAVEMSNFLKQLKDMVAANPVEDQSQWDRALTNVSNALRSIIKEEPTVDGLKALMGLKSQKDTTEARAYDKLRTSFLQLIPRAGSPLDNLEEVKKALSMLLGRAEGANLTIDPKMKQGKLVYEINYIIASPNQMKQRIQQAKG
ncbi:MAG: hypothetical protein LLG04_14585 [Parachlamydia sp.]|nr:hypothetical protein [Parachlamydia sp.]